MANLSSKYKDLIVVRDTVEPLTTDSLYYGNIHNADKRPRSQIILL